jgi:TM2 domain-containing membrane protein YozV
MEMTVTDPLLYTQGMTDSQRLLFVQEFNQRRKTGTTAVLLALFLGGVGAHRFYMGQIGIGIVYVVFCWTAIPAIVALIEIFLMGGRVDRYNAGVAEEVGLRVKALTSSTVN